MTALTSNSPLVSPERLAESYRHCEHIAKTQARNFYFSFVTLPPERKAAMCAIYAFMRFSDDVSDGDETVQEAAENTVENAKANGNEERAAQMRAWRAALDRALAGDYGDSLLWPAFHDTVIKYAIPGHYFHELIDGTEMDLTQNRYETWTDLHRYCYRVASVVGFVCIHVWGFDPAGGKALAHAEACGLALQLTNILRDVKEDAERNRIYLPQEDLRRFKVSEKDLKAGRMTPEFRALMQFEVTRAKGFYQQAQELIPLVNSTGRPTLKIMIRIYRGILASIEKQGYDVHSHRARVSTPKKIGIVVRAWLGGKVRKAVGQE